MKISDLITWYLVFLYSISFHEAAHAFTAWVLGDNTAYLGGQVNLDPWPHIRRAPLGMVVVPLLTFLLGGWMIGWASTPYNLKWAAKFPRRAGLMALAGPLANFTLVLLSGLAIRHGVETNIFRPPAAFGFTSMTQAVGAGWSPLAAKVLSIAFSLNLLLATFNLIPLPPLDGASILLLLADRSLGAVIFGLIRNRSLQGIGLIFAWKVFGQIFRPVQLYAAHMLYPNLIF